MSLNFPRFVTSMVHECSTMLGTHIKICQFIDGQANVDRKEYVNKNR